MTKVTFFQTKNRPFRVGFCLYFANSLSEQGPDSVSTHAGANPLPSAIFHDARFERLVP